MCSALRLERKKPYSACPERSDSELLNDSHPLQPPARRFGQTTCMLQRLVGSKGRLLAVQADEKVRCRTTSHHRPG